MRTSYFENGAEKHAFRFTVVLVILGTLALSLCSMEIASEELVKAILGAPSSLLRGMFYFCLSLASLAMAMYMTWQGPARLLRLAHRYLKPW